MPNFPSVYIELQELWKRLRQFESTLEETVTGLDSVTSILDDLIECLEKQSNAIRIGCDINFKDITTLSPAVGTTSLTNDTTHLKINSNGKAFAGIIASGTNNPGLSLKASEGGGSSVEIIAGNNSNGSGGSISLTSGIGTNGDGGLISLMSAAGVDGGPIDITSGNGTTGRGGDIDVTAGDSVVGQGGNISLTAGSNLTNDGDGGDILITAGDGDAVSGTPNGMGGRVIIKSGASSNATGGNIFITTSDSARANDLEIKGGNSIKASIGGVISINSGNSFMEGGYLSIVAGQGTGSLAAPYLAEGGLLNLAGGAGRVIGGNINIIAGDSTGSYGAEHVASNRKGGDVYISAGTSTTPPLPNLPVTGSIILDNLPEQNNITKLLGIDDNNVIKKVNKDSLPTAGFKIFFLQPGTKRTFSIPEGAKYVRITCIGAGQAGTNGTWDATQPKFGFGGQGGGYSSAVFRRGELKDTVTVVVGAGGSADGIAGSSSFVYYNTDPEKDIQDPTNVKMGDAELDKLLHSANRVYCLAIGGGLPFQYRGIKYHDVLLYKDTLNKLKNGDSRGGSPRDWESILSSRFET